MSANADGPDGPESRGPIRVWRADLDRPDAEIEALGAHLSADERERADRFRFPADRRRFTAARGLLRVLLGRTLGVSPREIDFSYGAFGKPALRHPADSGLEFNLTHSQGMALIAISWGRNVGIDLEFHRQEFNFRVIADRFFTARESGQIEALPESARRSAFFRVWTLKEAFLKARGNGLWLGLDQFEVTTDPDLPPRLLETTWDPNEARRWTLHGLDVTEGFSAAMAVEGVVPGPFVVESL
jgi:4'-phosphopantetheinyl transferase